MSWSRDQIIQGDRVNLNDYYTSQDFYDLLYQKLVNHPLNANCMYYVAKCFASDQRPINGSPPCRRQALSWSRDAKYREYLEKAIILGSSDALFDRGYLENSIDDGLEALQKGFRLLKHQPRYKNTYDREEAHKVCRLFINDNKYRDYHDLVLCEHINRLEQKVSVLTADLEQERLRPPEVGGSDYNKAKEHFGTLQ